MLELFYLYEKFSHEKLVARQERFFFQNKLGTLVITEGRAELLYFFKLSVYRSFFFFAGGAWVSGKGGLNKINFAHLKKYQLNSFITKSFIFVLKHAIGSATGQCLLIAGSSTIYTMDG